MKPEFKARWVEALRSGTYTQTKAVLKNSDGYCCLGVAKEVLGLEQDESGDELLAPESGERIGLKRIQQDLLATLNDGSRISPREAEAFASLGMDELPVEGVRKTFPEIADFIEKYL